MLENTFMDFFYIKSAQTDAFEAFLNSPSRVPSTSSLTEYSYLTKVIAATPFSINNPFLTLAPKTV